MAILYTTPTLKLDEIAYVHRCEAYSATIKPGALWFCSDQVQRLFDVPNEAPKLWLEFHDRPAASRYDVVVTHEYYHHGVYETILCEDDDMAVEIDGVEVFVEGRTGRSIFRKIGERKKVSLKVYYEDA